MPAGQRVRSFSGLWIGLVCRWRQLCKTEPSTFPVPLTAAACVYGGRKVGSDPASAAEPGHTFQLISTITFLIANKLISYATGASETPKASLLPASGQSPPLTENINLLLTLA